MFGNILGAAQRFLQPVQQFGRQAAGAIIGGVQKLAGGAQQIGQQARQAFIPPPAPIARAQQPIPPPSPRQLPPQPPLPQATRAVLPASPTFNPPSPQQFGVPSQEEANKRFAEETMRRYGEIVAPHEQALSSFLSLRRPVGEIYTEESARLGIPEKEKVLSGLETDILRQQGLLETLPTEAIQRRQETGMLSEAARRRIEAMEERPIREQLLKTGQLAQTADVGYNRALQLSRQAADIYGQETEAGVRPLQSNLDAARAQFGVVADSIAQQVSGLTQDRESLLRQYEGAVNQGYQLSQIQAQQAGQLKQQEGQHIQTMQVVANMTRDIERRMTLNSVMGKYLAQGMDPDTILSLYNAYSPFGVVKETPGILQSRYGVGGTRFSGITGGGGVQALIDQGA